MFAMEFTQKSFVGFLVEGGRTSGTRFAQLIQMDDCGQNMLSFATLYVINASVSIRPPVTILVQIHFSDNGQLLRVCSF